MHRRQRHTTLQAYFFHENNDPTTLVRKVIKEKQLAILGCDANARNTGWKAKEINKNDKSLIIVFKAKH